MKGRNPTQLSLRKLRVIAKRIRRARSKAKRDELKELYIAEFYGTIACHDQ
jgi:hypothetical protein